MLIQTKKPTEFPVIHRGQAYLFVPVWTTKKVGEGKEYHVHGYRVVRSVGYLTAECVENIEALIVGNVDREVGQFLDDGISPCARKPAAPSGVSG